MNAESSSPRLGGETLSRRAVLFAAAPLLASHAALLVNWDLAERLAVTIGLLLVASASLIWAVRRLTPMEGAPGAAGVLLVAVLLRLFLLPLPPTLSDDALRYVWDGKVAGAGLNPYLLAPDDPSLESLRDPLWSELPHRDVPTVYPPLALGLFSIAAHLPNPALAVKALLVACDLLACLLLLRLAAALGLPQTRTLWYAWNPLVVLEVAGMGHVDALGVVFVVGGMLALCRRPSRPISAALLAAGAVLAKLIPLALVPWWSRASRRPLLFIGVVALTIGAGLAPVVVSTAGVPPGLQRFAVSWEFNGPLYEPLWRLSEALDVHGRVEARLDRAKLEDGRHEHWNRFYPYNYPQLHAKLVLLLGLGAALLWTLRRRHPVTATGSVLGTILIFSATVYPWYLLWVLPAAALCGHRAYLLLSMLLPLSYLAQFSDLALMPWVFGGIWVPFFATLWFGSRWSID